MMAISFVGLTNRQVAAQLDALLDPRVATVSLTPKRFRKYANGECLLEDSPDDAVVLPSTRFALAFVPRYLHKRIFQVTTDEEAVRRVFGGGWDVDTLQAEALGMLVQAADMFLRRGKKDWKAYLAKALIYHLDSLRKHRRSGDDVSLDDWYYDDEEGQYEKDLPEQLIVDDVCTLVERMEFRNELFHIFLDTCLTERQRKIMDLRYVRYVHGEKLTDAQIAAQCGISRIWLYEEVKRMQEKFHGFLSARDA